MFEKFITNEEFKQLAGILKVGDYVSVHHESEENARKLKTKRKLLAILPESYNYRYICTTGMDSEYC